MRNPASSRAKTSVIWLTLPSGLGEPLRICQFCERCYFQYAHPWDCATGDLSHAVTRPLWPHEDRVAASRTLSRTFWYVIPCP